MNVSVEPLCQQGNPEQTWPVFVSICIGKADCVRKILTHANGSFRESPVHRCCSFVNIEPFENLTLSHVTLNNLQIFVLYPLVSAANYTENLHTASWYITKLSTWMYYMFHNIRCCTAASMYVRRLQRNLCARFLQVLGYTVCGGLTLQC